MNNRLIVTFDKSQEDIPVLLVSQENMFGSIYGGGSSFTVLNTITGDKAVDIWNKLKNKTNKEN